NGTGPNPPEGPVVTLPLQSDTDVLKYALFLELLEEDFYIKAVQSGNLSGNVSTLATSVRDHESAHVDALQAALAGEAFGSGDVGFDFGDSFSTQANFLATAQTLEQTGVGAYLGAIGLIQSKALRTTAGSIFTIEARHTAAFRAYNNASGGPVPAAFESPVTPELTVDAVVATGFVIKGL
ncbi:MAG: ferritin-like domain-containing protein, partial [Gemmatimonadales bacterium]